MSEEISVFKNKSVGFSDCKLILCMHFFSCVMFKGAHLISNMPFKYHNIIHSTTVYHITITLNVSLGLFANLLRWYHCSCRDIAC